MNINEAKQKATSGRRQDREFAQLGAQSLRVMDHVLAIGSAPASARIVPPTLKLAMGAAMRHK